MLELLRDLAQETGTAMVYVSHDLGAIARVCERVVVMYAGEIVLDGSVRQVLLKPVHPYARSLLASIPKLREASLPAALDGRPPAPGDVGNGCAFAARCAMVEDRCTHERPSLQVTKSGERVRCHLFEKVEQLAAPGPGTAVERSSLKQAPEVLALDNIAISYTSRGLLDQILGRQPNDTPTVDDISLVIRKGETIGLVGESGSGKSTILKAIAGLIPARHGNITYNGNELLKASIDQRDKNQLRRIQLIFQNPDDSLNPRQTVAEILAQPLRLYFGLSNQELHDRSVEILERVRLGGHYLERLPSQLSGGEKQRVAVARAFIAEPELVLCDEVTSALDVSVQAAVLGLLNRLQREFGTTYIFVSHDLAVVRALADRVALLYQGRLCEIGPVADVYSLPSHPYTEVLLGAVLEPHPDSVPVLSADDIVELSPMPIGCPFQRRCPRRLGEICDTQTPPWQQVSSEHLIRCHIPHSDLQKIQTQQVS